VDDLLDGALAELLGVLPGDEVVRLLGVRTGVPEAVLQPQPGVLVEALSDRHLAPGVGLRGPDVKSHVVVANVTLLQIAEITPGGPSTP